ncbi:MAG: hypothetical protein HYZ16_02260 [Bacteroidetes bacterium]|jgi:hypothetical protein|nr:hypothetical protein [Bacteroidota bacterium]
MKKVLMFCAAGFLAASLFTSCEKCTTCDIEVDGTVVTAGTEVCGKKSEIDDYEASIETAAKLVGGEAVCK